MCTSDLECHTIGERIGRNTLPGGTLVDLHPMLIIERRHERVLVRINQRRLACVGGHQKLRYRRYGGVADIAVRYRPSGDG